GPTDIVHNGGLEGITDYTVFRLRYAKKKNLPVRLLTDWYIQEASPRGEGRICIVGNYKENIIRTSAVVSIQSKRRVITANGVYILGTSTEVMSNVLPGNLQEHFTDGFPLNWKTLAYKAFLEEEATEDFDKLADISKSLLDLPGLEALDPCVSQEENNSEKSILKLCEKPFFSKEEGDFSKSSFIKEEVIEFNNKKKSIEIKGENEKSVKNDEDELSTATESFFYDENEVLMKREEAFEYESELKSTNSNVTGREAVLPQIFVEEETSNKIFDNGSGKENNKQVQNIGVHCDGNNSIPGTKSFNVDNKDAVLSLNLIKGRRKQTNRFEKANSTYATVEETVKAMPFYKNKRKRMSEMNNSELLSLVLTKRKPSRKPATLGHLKCKEPQAKVLDSSVMSADTFLEEMNKITAETKEDGKKEEDDMVDIQVPVIERVNPLGVGSEFKGDFNVSIPCLVSEESTMNECDNGVSSSPEDQIKPNLSLLSTHLKDQKITQRTSLSEGSDKKASHRIQGDDKFKTISASGVFLVSHEDAISGAKTISRYGSLSFHDAGDGRDFVSGKAEMPVKSKSLGGLSDLEGLSHHFQENTEMISAIPGVDVYDDSSEPNCNDGQPEHLLKTDVNKVQPESQAPEEDNFKDVVGSTKPVKKRISIDLHLSRDIGKRAQVGVDNVCFSESIVHEGTQSVDGMPVAEEPVESNNTLKSGTLSPITQKVVKTPTKSIPKKRKRTICRFNRK
ncbi:hypothetical protein PAEPH01_2257, partial [Pancytospora epiphaga]